MPKRNLLVLCGGRSAEHEVALQSAINVVAAVDRAVFDLAVVGIDKDGTWRRLPVDAFAVNLADPALTALAPAGQTVTLGSRGGQGWLTPLDHGEPWRIDVAFPVLHGTYGEDGTMQGLLAMMNIPYVGCDHTSSANCMDKAVTKQILRYAGIPVAEGFIVTGGTGAISAAEIGRGLGWPVFVKPARLGSSVGVHKVKAAADLEAALADALRYDDKVLVERYLPGREIECAVLGNECPRAAVPGEVVPNPRHGFYSYPAKYLDEAGARLDAPADLPAEVVARVQDLAVRAFAALGCSGMARVDFFLMPDGGLIVNELNTIPGFTKISMYPRLWQLSGVTYPQLVSELIRLAEERHAARARLCTSFT
jgi:D-alanine-D-alanine ligase